MTLLGILVLVLLLGLVRALGGFPVVTESRWAHRVLPVVELLLALGLVGSMIGALAGPEAHAGLGLLVALLGLGIAAIALGRDYVSGIVLRSSGVLRVGDQVRVGEAEGALAELRVLHLVLRTPSGQLLVPYRTVQQQTLAIDPAARHDAVHTFALAWSGPVSLAEATALVERTALLHASAAAGRPPEVVPTGPFSLEVALVVLDQAAAYEVEGQVRLALEALVAERAGSSRE